MKHLLTIRRTRRGPRPNLSNMFQPAWGFLRASGPPHHSASTAHTCVLRLLSSRRQAFPASNCVCTCQACPTLKWKLPARCSSKASSWYGPYSDMGKCSVSSHHLCRGSSHSAGYHYYVDSHSPYGELLSVQLASDKRECSECIVSL